MNLLQSLKNLLPNKTQYKIRQDMKLTDWYSGKSKPAYKGVYERRSSYGFSHYSYWNGSVWKQMAFTPEKAEQLSWDDDSFFQTLEWRGVAK